MHSSEPQYARRVRTTFGLGPGAVSRASRARDRTDHPVRAPHRRPRQQPDCRHIGGSARVLQNFSITQCDALCKLAGIRLVADGPGQP